MRLEKYGKLTAVILAAVLMASAAACNSGKESSSQATTAMETPSSTAKPSDAAEKPTATPAETTAGDFVFPAEGKRPYAVMIDNEGTRSLPQGGLDKAQLIYEIIVEGGETRLMPLYWEMTPTMIGPVRSSRHYFLDYVLEHDAIYVHFGWSIMAQRDIPKLKINNINGVANGGEIFWDLTKQKSNWQDSYTSMEKIKNYSQKVKYRSESGSKLVFGYNKSDIEFPEGNKAEKLTLRYSAAYTSGFTYDAASKTYLRFRKGNPHMERVTGKQLTAKNIVIQKVSNHTIKGDKYGRQELATVGSGSGWHVTDGKAVEIKWTKAARNAPTQYRDLKGNAILLNPGQTWIQIVPADGQVKIE
jgi:hypothetical protein